MSPNRLMYKHSKQPYGAPYYPVWQTTPSWGELKRSEVNTKKDSNIIHCQTLQTYFKALEVSWFFVLISASNVHIFFFLLFAVWIQWANIKSISSIWMRTCVTMTVMSFGACIYALKMCLVLLVFFYLVAFFFVCVLLLHVSFYSLCSVGIFPLISHFSHFQ